MTAPDSPTPDPARERETLAIRPFIAVAALGEVPEEGCLPVEVGNRSILLCRSLGAVYAVENQCSHAHQPLDGGRVRRGWLMCPFHGARFDLASGAAIGPPATEPIATFPVRVVGETIEVAL